MSIEFSPVPALAEVRRHPRLLGELDPLVDLIAGASGEPAPASAPLAPALPRTPVLVVFAAAHGANELGVSAFRPEETANRVRQLREGTGPVATTAAQAGVAVRCVDFTSAEGALSQEHPAIPGRRIDLENALTVEELRLALQSGKDAADREVDAGADLLIGAVCGVGVSTPAAVLLAAVTGMEPVDATGRGSGIDDAGWIRKVAVVRDALYRTRLAGTDAATLLQCAGGADLAALTGFIAQAAVRRTPVLVDDISSTLGAVLAARVAPGAGSYVVSTSISKNRGHRRLLDLLGIEPLTTWSVRLGSGLASVMLVPLIRAAVTAHAATADAAGDPAERTDNAVTAWAPELL